jgi:hypothetical protein
MPFRGFSLDGKIALVTGAGRGLGLEAARGLAAAGAPGTHQRPHPMSRVMCWPLTAGISPISEAGTDRSLHQAPCHHFAALKSPSAMAAGFVKRVSWPPSTSTRK